MTDLIIEALAVGVGVMIIGLLLMWLAKNILPKTNLNTFFAHTVMLFILGVTVHLVCEWIGVNNWYCKNGSACKNR